MKKRIARWMIALGTGLILIAGGTCAVMRSNRRAGTASTPQASFERLTVALTPPPLLQELVERYPTLAGVLNNPEVDSAYKEFLIAYQEGSMDAASEWARRRGLLTAQNEVQVTLVLDTAESGAVLSQLESMGVTISSVHGRQVGVVIPLALIEEAANSGDLEVLFSQLSELAHVVRVKLPPKMHIQGVVAPFLTVDGQGVKVIGADAWHDAGWTGEGIKIGILDCGFGGYKALLGSELPVSVEAKTFVRGLTDADTSDQVHGTAVAEIVHEIAPGAQLLLADYGCSGTVEGQAVDWLLERGVHIISHSASHPSSPMDGSGWSAELVRLAAGKGVLWINSAGNEAETHYRDLSQDQDGDRFHEFAQNQQTMAFRSEESSVEIALRWDDWRQVDQDFDLFLLDGEGHELGRSSNVQAGLPGDEPIEIIEYNGLIADETYYVAIYTANATHQVTFDLIVYGKTTIEFPVAGYSLGSPADAVGALAVGATLWQNDQIASYSSRGPTADERIKPDLSAPTYMDNATYGHFGGTSAAAPHVAGAAALVWSAFPEWDRQQVWECLVDNAIDLGPHGLDSTYGAGRVQLPAPPVSEPSISPTSIPIGPSPTLTPQSAETATPPDWTATPTHSPLAPVTRSLPRNTPTPLPTLSTQQRGPRHLVGWAAGLAGAMGSLMLFIGLITATVNTHRTRLAHPRLPSKPAPHWPNTAAIVYIACPHCGHPLRQGAAFCAACGKGVGVAAPRCTQCGQPLRAEARFCARCGMKQ